MGNLQFGIQNLTKHCNEALILSVLFKERKHGYQLVLEIEQKSAGQFTFNHGTLYPILHKLEKEGFIKGNWQQDGGKRKRKYYSITEKGRKYAREQFGAWKHFINHFLSVVGEIEK